MSTTVRDQLRASLTEMAPGFGPDVPIEKQREILDSMGAAAQPPAGLEVTHRPLAGMKTEWLTTPGCSTSKALLHLHGGGFAMGSCDSHRALVGHIANACGVQAVLPEYRLAPEHRYPAGLDDCVAAYLALREQGFAADDIVMMGDSAGGGLTLSTLLALRDAGEALPKAAVLLSPFTDLTCVGESFQTRADLDPWLSPELFEPIIAKYVDQAQRGEPRVSPLFAELGGLPPMLIQVGDHEILRSDSTRFAERATAAGVDVDLEVWPDVWHVWHLFAPALPDANDAIAKIGAYVRGQLEPS